MNESFRRCKCALEREHTLRVLMRGLVVSLQSITVTNAHPQTMHKASLHSKISSYQWMKDIGPWSRYKILSSRPDCYVTIRFLRDNYNMLAVFSRPLRCSS